MRIMLSLALICALTACKQNSPSNVAPATTAIAGGKAVNFLTDNLAHMVVGLKVISHPQTGASKTQICTAVLVSTNVVLTAAHCLDSKNTEAYVIFSPNINTAPSREIRLVTSKSILPTWRGAADIERGDLALARFQGQAPMGYYSMSPTDSAADVTDDAKVFEFGYGAVIPASNEGEGILHKAFAYLKSEFSTNHLEAKVAQGEVMLCTGDLGGPIFVVDQSSWKIWGIASRMLEISPGNSNCGKTAIYTMTMPYKAWLQSETARLQSL